MKAPALSQQAGELSNRLRAMVSTDGRAIVCNGRTTRQMGEDILAAADRLDLAPEQTGAGSVDYMALAAAFGPVLKAAFPEESPRNRMATADALATEVQKRESWFRLAHAKEQAAGVDREAAERISTAILHADTSNSVWRGLLLDSILAALAKAAGK